MLLQLGISNFTYKIYYNSQTASKGLDPHGGVTRNQGLLWHIQAHMMFYTTCNEYKVYS